MRLPHHLIRHSSGVWYFRQSVPPDLRKLFGVRVFKKSLRTHDPAVARVCAYALGAQYALDGLQLRDWCQACGIDLVDWATEIEHALGGQGTRKRKK